MSNQLNLPQVDSNQIVETSQRCSTQKRMNLSSISRAKGLNTYVNKVFLFIFLINVFILCVDDDDTFSLFNPFKNKTVTLQNVEKGKGSEYFPNALYMYTFI